MYPWYSSPIYETDYKKFIPHITVQKKGNRWETLFDSIPLNPRDSLKDRYTYNLNGCHSSLFNDSTICLKNTTLDIAQNLAIDNELKNIKNATAPLTFFFTDPSKQHQQAKDNLRFRYN